MKSAIVVLGMHRSGTSALTGALCRLGAAEPKTAMATSSENDRGYFESQVVMEFNDQLLASAGSFWSDWRAFPDEWNTTDTADGFQRRATEVLEAEFGDAPLIALKDPRTCRFAPFWLKALDTAGYETRCVIPVRSPLEVAESLRKRTDMPLEEGVLLWLRHMLDAERFTRDQPRAIMSFQGLLQDWRGTVGRLSEQIGQDWPRSIEEAGGEIDWFLSDGLRHHWVDDVALQSRPEVSAWARAAYQGLLALRDSPRSADVEAELDGIRSALDETSRIFGPIFAHAESRIQTLRAAEARLVATVEEDRVRNGELIGKASDLTRQVDGLTGQVGELTDQLAEVDAARVAERAETETRIAELDGHLSETAGQLAQAHAEHASARADAETRIAELDRHLSETAGQLAQANAEHAATRADAETRIAELNGRADDLAGQLALARTEAETRITELNNHLGEITGQLAQTRSDLDHRGRQIEVLTHARVELAEKADALRAALAHSEARLEVEGVRAARLEIDLANARAETEALRTRSFMAAQKDAFRGLVRR